MCSFAAILLKRPSIHTCACCAFLHGNSRHVAFKQEILAGSSSILSCMNNEHLKLVKLVLPGATAAAAGRQSKCTTVQRCGARCRPCQVPRNGKAFCVKQKGTKQSYACSIRCNPGFEERILNGAVACTALARYGPSIYRCTVQS